jgi:hypothetical protein
MSREELSELTRIPIRSLERLEGGQFDGGSDGFVRGFVRTVAEALGLDVEDAVARTLQEPGAGTWERPGASRSLKRALAGLVFVILLALGFAGMRAVWQLLLGEASRSTSREVVLWRDPVWGLAEATGAQPDARVGLEPSGGRPAAGEEMGEVAAAAGR